MIGGMISIAEDLISDSVISLGSCQLNYGSITEYCLSFALGGLTKGLDLGKYAQFWLTIGKTVFNNDVNNDWNSFDLEETAFKEISSSMTGLIEIPVVGPVISGLIEVFYDYHEVKYEK